ncbi:unnamed protein product [Lota lota]
MCPPSMIATGSVGAAICGLQLDSSDQSTVGRQSDRPAGQDHKHRSEPTVWLPHGYCSDVEYKHREDSHSLKHAWLSSARALWHLVCLGAPECLRRVNSHSAAENQHVVPAGTGSQCVSLPSFTFPT